MFKIQYSNTSKELLKNYGLTSILKHFSNILERVMYNRLYSCLDQNSILYNKQFGFRGCYSSDHPLIEFVDNIYNPCNENKYTLGVSIDLPNVIDFYSLV